MEKDSIALFMAIFIMIASLVAFHPSNTNGGATTEQSEPCEIVVPAPLQETNPLAPTGPITVDKNYNETSTVPISIQTWEQDHRRGTPSFSEISWVEMADGHDYFIICDGMTSMIHGAGCRKCNIAAEKALSFPVNP